MIKFMLDTDISIYTIKRKPLEVKRMFNIHSGEIAISTVTLSGLIYGVEKSRNQQRNLESVEGFVGRLEVINYDVAAAYQFGQLKQELKGQNIGPYDFMIAAHARSLGLTLISNNTKEFEHVAGLRVENWVKTDTNPR
ncbi:MAG: tRNA(fMet)-specific endonuclease VapC [Methylococcaceae bacterium]